MTDLFITTYLTRPKMTRHPHKSWPLNFDLLKRLGDSVAPHAELVVCADQLPQRRIPLNLRNHVTIHPVTRPVENVYFERWDLIRDVLQSRQDARWVYACDARDVIVVRDPFDFMEPGVLYTCTEPASLPGLRRWRGQPLGVSGFINDRKFHSSSVIQKWVRENPRLVALNAGVVAADRATMLRFATRMAEERHAPHVARDYTDMALFNYLAYTEFDVVGSEQFIGAKCHTETEAPEARVIHVA